MKYLVVCGQHRIARLWARDMKLTDKDWKHVTRGSDFFGRDRDVWRVKGLTPCGTREYEILAALSEYGYQNV